MEKPLRTDHDGRERHDRGGRGRDRRRSRGAQRSDPRRADQDVDWRRRARPPASSSDRVSRPGSAPTTRPAESEMLRGPVVGTCMVMCSPDEVRTRREINDLSRFESPPHATRADTSWAVKKYRRPAAGRVEIDASELRPPKVLKETLVHLFRNVVPWEGGGFDWSMATTSSPPAAMPHEFLALYHFISDRLRSVRQDFVVQRVVGQSRVAALVQIARFYVLASFRATQLLDFSDTTLDWSETLNDQQLASALTEVHAQLLSATNGSEESDQSLHEEALGYDVLLHLRDAHAVSLLLLKIPTTLRRRESVRRVLALFVAFHTGDSVRFVKLFRALPPVQQCLALRHLPVVWVAAIARMNKAYFGKIERFPLDEVATWVGLPSEHEARLLCRAMDVPIEDDIPPVDSDLWETDAVIGFARFKINPSSEVLADETERELLRTRAKLIQNELMRQHTATSLIIDS